MQNVSVSVRSRKYILWNLIDVASLDLRKINGQEREICIRVIKAALSSLTFVYFRGGKARRVAKSTKHMTKTRIRRGGYPVPARVSDPLLRARFLFNGGALVACAAIQHPVYPFRFICL